MVEVDGGLVPVEDAPFEARATLGDSNGGDARKQRFANALAAKDRTDEEVFEIDARVASPGGVAVEVEGKACGCAVVLGHEAMETAGLGEAVAVKVGLGGEDGVGLALILGQLADEGENLGDVVRSGGADIEFGHALLS